MGAETRHKPARAKPERTRRVPVDMPEETAPERWLRRLRLSGFSAVALGLLILAVVVLAPSLRLVVEQQQQIAALERAVAAEQATNEGLRAELDRWSDPAYIEAQARQRLMFVYPGEYSYVVVDAEAGEDAAPTAAPSAELQTTRIDWLRGLLAATFHAGLTQEEAADLPLVGGAW